MANTYVDYTAPQANYSFTFPYLDVSHVKVFVDNVEKTQGTHYTVATSPTRVVFTAGNTPANGATVRIRRVTYRDAALVDFANGSTLLESDLDTAVRQTLYINQETTELNDTALQLGAGSSNFYAQNKKITDLASPTANLDAANKTYVDTQISNIGQFGSSTAPTRWVFTGNGATDAFVLTGATASGATNYLVYINGSAKDPTVDYTFNAGTSTLTFSTPPANLAKVLILAVGYRVPTEVQVADGAVTSAKLASTIDFTGKTVSGLTKSNVGLGNVQNVDQTNADNISSGTLNASRLPASAAKLDTAQEFTRTQNFNATTLTDAASISWDLSQNQVAAVTLGGNRALANPTNQVDGAVYILEVKQDGTGGRTLSFGSAYKFPGSVAPVITTGASKVDILTFVSDGTFMYGVSAQSYL